MIDDETFRWALKDWAAWLRWETAFHEGWVTVGQDFLVSWKPANQGARIRFELIAIYHAGNGPMVICDTEDDGSLVVPASIITAYWPHRYAQFETTQLIRDHRAQSEVGLWFDVAAARACW